MVWCFTALCLCTSTRPAVTQPYRHQNPGPSASISSTQNGGNLETRCAQTSKFLIPIFPCFEPGALIGGDRAAPQPVACSGLGVARKISHAV